MVSYRVVAVVAGNSEAITLGNLRSNTQYQLVVTAVKDNKKLRSRPIVFRTLEPTKPHLQDVSIKASSPLPPLQQQRTYIQIRAVEVGLVLLALVVWAGAIALFFNRWGKIRMLLPYQPDFKDQLKVPGTGVCNSSNTGHNHSTGQHTCPQVFPFGTSDKINHLPIHTSRDLNKGCLAAPEQTGRESLEETPYTLKSFLIH
ncbi:hypothetical protein TKK_0012976 [Trichogramma kaykai]